MYVLPSGELSVEPESVVRSSLWRDGRILAVILDPFSRKVVGWKLAETLEAELVVMAFENALMMRQPIRACTSTPIKAAVTAARRVKRLWP